MVMLTAYDHQYEKYDADSGMLHWQLLIPPMRT